MGRMDAGSFPGKGDEPRADVRSFGVREQLQRKWRDTVRTLPPDERRAWLKSAEGIVALGAKNARQLVRALDRDERELRRDVPSSCWFDDFWYRKVEFPPGGRKATRMRVSVVTGRWTPPQCLALEDMIDGLNEVNAIWLSLQWPASPSAVAIQRIESQRPHRFGKVDVEVAVNSFPHLGALDARLVRESLSVIRTNLEPEIGRAHV